MNLKGAAIKSMKCLKVFWFGKEKARFIKIPIGGEENFRVKG